jgi:hypothetical protein
MRLQWLKKLLFLSADILEVQARPPDVNHLEFDLCAPSRWTRVAWATKGLITYAASRPQAQSHACRAFSGDFDCRGERGGTSAGNLVKEFHGQSKCAPGTSTTEAGQAPVRA